MISTVAYSIGTYSGEVRVFNVDPDDETEHVIARAKKQLTREAGGPAPFGAQSWREIRREAEPT